jgi:hypothetical protein
MVRRTRKVKRTNMAGRISMTGGRAILPPVMSAKKRTRKVETGTETGTETDTGTHPKPELASAAEKP